jgi:hypothetical protein
VPLLLLLLLLLLLPLRRSRFWLFLSYVVSFASVVGAVWVLMQHYGEWCGAALCFYSLQFRSSDVGDFSAHTSALLLKLRLRIQQEPGTVGELALFMGVRG